MVRTWWLSLQARVQSLVWELRSHKPLGQKKKKKEREREIDIQKKVRLDFPGGPVAKILCSQCRRPGFAPWLGNSIPHAATKTWCSQINLKF